MAALVVGVPKEIKDKENRVSVLPDGVAELTHYGHRVVVQAGAGAGCGFSDAEYEAAGAEVVDTPEAVFAAADLKRFASSSDMIGACAGSMAG